MFTRKLLIALAIPSMLTACVAPPKYVWGNYDQSLYNYYKDSTKSEAHLKELEGIVTNAKSTNGKVAPGIHAEYGYFLLREGKAVEASAQFNNEKRLWPESTVLMDTMIKIASTTPVKSIASKE